MKWLYGGPDGQAWKDSHIKIYGWGEIGANGSNSRDSLAPAGYPIRPDRIELDQLVMRIERLPDLGGALLAVGAGNERPH